jgi:hypothetical protein
MFRVGAEQEPAALRLPGASRMVLRKRRLPGFVSLKPARCKGATLKKALGMAKKYVGRLPTKKRADGRKTRQSARG